MGKNSKKGNLTFKAFDAKHKRGGGGFISVEVYHDVLRDQTFKLACITEV